MMRKAKENARPGSGPRSSKGARNEATPGAGPSGTDTKIAPDLFTGVAGGSAARGRSPRRDAPGKGAIVSFELQGIHAHDVSMVIDRQGVAVRAGTHCAQPLLKRFGVTSTCRASFGMYNTRAEVDALADALEKARKFFG